LQQREMYAGRYRLGPELGRGGMGVVHVAHDEQLDRDVAVKTMALSARTDPVAAGRFEREARALAAVHHPGVVAVYDYGESDGELYLVMQLVEGGSLEHRLSGHRRLSPSRTVELATGIASALDALHARGLVHRDVKPSNILLDGPDQQPVLCDFGLAKPTAVTDGLTSTGETVGTVHYMAPEQLMGDRATRASDVYALGCVIFHCLTGRPPFTGADVHEVAGAHRVRPVPDVRSLVPDLPAAVQPVLERCLAKDPAARWPSAGAVAEALRATVQQPDAAAQGFTAVLPTTPVPAALTEPEVEPDPAQNAFPRRLAAACAALVVLVGLAGAALGYASGGDGTADADGAASPASPLDAGEQQLAGLLSDEFGDCSALDRVAGQVAKLNCDRTPEGIASLHAVQWEDTDAMREWFQSSYVESGSYQAAPCGDFDGGIEARGTGHVSTRPGVGAIACYVNANGDVVLLWQVDDRALSLFAIRDDADAAALFDWWQSARDGVLRSER
jgi:hypothetical protein